jgi:hypothetical protein
MLIEIHAIQNHSPSNLNRDDLGAPKTCFFGGVLRSRISSQCLKRSIRNPGNPDDVHNREPGMFAEAMAGHMGIRTKFFPSLVGQVLDDPAVEDRLRPGTSDLESSKKAIIAACKVIAKKEKDETGGNKRAVKKDDRPQTPQLIFLGPGHARKFVETLLEAIPEHREHFLDPATIFESLLEQELQEPIATSLTDDQRERAIQAAWRIKHTPQRIERLKEVMSSQTEESDTQGPDRDVKERNDAAAESDDKYDESDEDAARFIAQALDVLAAQDPKEFESITSSKGRKGEPKLDTRRKEPKKYSEFLGSLAAIHSGDAVDIALFGRMTTSDAFKDVEAAMQVAHAISTHAVVNEVDYFTAVDDRERVGGGAGHVGEAMLNSACFYKYFCLDWDQLVYNLAGPEPDQKKDAEGHKKWRDEVKPSAERLAACTLGHFIRAVARTTPSGKQNSFASFCEPCGMLVEVKRTKTPTSYANAFAEPVERIGKADEDAPDEKSVEGRSVACLADHVQSMRRAYCIDSALLWYSPKLWRFPLRYWEREQDGKKIQAKSVPAQRFDVLGGEDGTPGLVEALVREIGFDWSDIKDVGRAPAKEA